MDDVRGDANERKGSKPFKTQPLSRRGFPLGHIGQLDTCFVSDSAALRRRTGWQSLVLVGLCLVGCDLKLKPHVRPGQTLPAKALRSRADDSSQRVADSVLASEPEAPPQARVDDSQFDFGVMNPHARGEHLFTVRNLGPGPLRFRNDRSTCKCTVGQFPKEPVAAGETAEVLIQWQTESNNARFEQSASVDTNDPNQPTLTFTITGDVLVRVGANPPQFSFPAVRPGETPETTTIVTSQVWDDFALSDIQSSLDGLTWEVSPATADELATLKAKHGYRLRITLPDTLAQGSFTHWVRFKVTPAGDVAESEEAAEPEEFELPLEGKVLRRLAVYGPGIDFQGNIQLGLVPLSKGATRRLILKVYDPDPELILEGIQVTPDFLQVRVLPYADGEPTKGLYYLDVEVPKSSPACRYQGQRAGEIQLQFSHPRISELRLRVHFAVADQLAIRPERVDLGS